MKKPPRGITPDAVGHAQKPSKSLTHIMQASEIAAHSAQPTTIALGACGICFYAMLPEQDIRCRAPIRGTAIHKVQLSCQHCFHKECIRTCILFGNKVSNCRASICSAWQAVWSLQRSKSIA